LLLAGKAGHRKLTLDVNAATAGRRFIAQPPVGMYV